MESASGDLAATTSKTGDTVLQLTTIPGDVALQLPLDVSKAPVVLNSDKYGNARAGQPATRYSWLDGKSWGGKLWGWTKPHKWDIALRAASFFVPGAGAAVWAYRAYRIVRVARAAKGMDGDLRAGRATSWLAGRMWVGRGSSRFGGNLGRIARDKLRPWRRPTHKSDGHWKSNFPWRNKSSQKWKNNYHVYHRRPAWRRWW